MYYMHYLLDILRSFVCDVSKPHLGQGIDLFFSYLNPFLRI